MLLWANTHGGFLLGQILLAYILMAETLKFVHPALAPLPRKEYKTLAISICSAILIVIINPNHIYSFEMMLPSGEANSYIYNSILEFSSLYECFKITKNPELVLALFTYIFTIILFINSRERTNITWIGLFILLSYMGMRHVRYYPFFLICATLFAIQHVATRHIGKITKFVLLSFFAAVVIVSSLKTPRNLQRISQYGWVPAAFYPVKACDFINTNAINGNVFTVMDWGGYVIWRLSPEMKVFFDGRQMDPARSWENMLCLDVSGTPPYWKAIFDKHNIQVVILPVFDHSFKPFPLKESIEKDSGWLLVHRANNGTVFVRN